MRRFNALLVVAGLAAAPVSAAAGPCPTSTSASQTETLESVPSQGRLGVLVMTLTPELRAHFGAARERGVLVARVEPLSPAARAGIVPGDVLTDVRGRAVADPADVVAALAGATKNQAVPVALVRDRKPMTVSVSLHDSMVSGLDAAPGMSWLRELFKPLRSAGSANDT